jgi:transcriptional antiterminator RfaH
MRYENHLDLNVKKWFAVRTRYKAEKDVCRQLNSKGIEAYVPLYRVTRQYTRKRKELRLPLINNYVFVRIAKEEYIPVLETVNVVSFVRFSQNLISIPDDEILLLKRICGENIPVKIVKLEFIQGDEVEIIGGKLTGIRGRLLDKRGKQFLVELIYIGIGLRLEIDPRQLTPVNRSTPAFIE